VVDLERGGFHGRLVDGSTGSNGASGSDGRAGRPGHVLIHARARSIEQRWHAETPAA
jgi:hypothetical protein